MQSSYGYDMPMKDVVEVDVVDASIIPILTDFFSVHVAQI
jgi:hypothetical protein